MSAHLQKSSKSYSARTRSFWRGLLAAVAAHALALTAFIASFSFLKPFVWLALSDAPYATANTPLDSDSIEWLAIQFGGFVTWLLTGVAASWWSAPEGKKWIYVLAVLVLIAPLVATPLATSSLLRQAVWWLASPSGLLLGVFLQRAWEQKQGAGLQRPPLTERDDA